MELKFREFVQESWGNNLANVAGVVGAAVGGPLGMIGAYGGVQGLRALGKVGSWYLNRRFQQQPEQEPEQDYSYHPEDNPDANAPYVVYRRGNKWVKMPNPRWKKLP